MSFPNIVQQGFAHRAARLAGAVALTAILTGCLTDPNIRDMQLDVHQTKLDVGSLQAAQSAEFRKMQYSLEQIQRSLEAQHKTDKAFADEIDQRLTAVHEDIAKIVVGSETGTAPGAGNYMGSGTETASSATAPPASADQKDLLRRALDEYERSEYDKAIELYSQFLISGANTASGAVANYALARCYYQKKDYDTAFQVFNYVVETYPANGDIIPKSLYSRALCEYQLSKFETSKETLKQVQATFPDFNPEGIQGLLAQMPK
jgi:TolA-binding protein